MRDSPGPVYEVTLDVTGHAAEEVDAWLDEHTQRMLEIRGFVDAETWRVDDDNADHVRRVTHYLLESRQALDDYLSGPASGMRRAASEQFGDDATATRRILEGKAGGQPERCRNCNAALGGQYCSRCGQRARSRLISIWELIQDAFGDLFELDSRLWQTLIPLISRPGSLTHEYLLGRRARYMPPFRTYLVLSVVFFLVAFFDPEQQLGILLEPGEDSVEAAGEQQTPAEVRQQVLKDLAADGIIAAPPAPEPGAGEKAKQQGERAPGANLEFAADGTAAFGCDLGDANFDDLPQWLSRRLTRERAQSICEKIRADSGREFINRLLDNVPAALFILMPLMAFVLKVLYPLSKRYYVEHLLFVLHFHAFFFLILTLEVLWSRLVVVLHLPEGIAGLTVFIISIYIPVYLYKAMRRVYEQGRMMTLLKFVFLVFSYLVGFTFMLLIATFYTAFSI